MMGVGWRRHLCGWRSFAAKAESARQSRAAGCDFWGSLALTVCGPKGQPNQGSIDVCIEKAFPALSDAHNPNPDISQCRVPLS